MITVCFPFVIGNDDPLLAQTEIGDDTFQDLRRKVPLEVPRHLKNVVSASRYLNPELLKDRRVNDPQVWFLGRKTRGRAARCSGCLVANSIRVGDLHLFVKGLLWDEKHKRIHHQNLNFCSRKSCVTKITSACNNIRPLDIYSETIKKCPNLGVLSREEKLDIQAEELMVEGIQPINLD